MMCFVCIDFVVQICLAAVFETCDAVLSGALHNAIHLTALFLLKSAFLENRPDRHLATAKN